LKRQSLNVTCDKRNFSFSFIHTETPQTFTLSGRSKQQHINASHNVPAKAADNTPLSPVSIYTLNHKKRDILFLTITLANLGRFL